MAAKKKTQKSMTVDEIAAELAETARIGEVFVDGELVKEAWMPYAREFMCGDEMDFNEVATVPIKKTLMRLERLCRVPCSTVIWRRRADYPDSGEPLLIGAYGDPLSCDKPAGSGYRPPVMTPELAAVFLKGKSRVIKVDTDHQAHMHVLHTRGISVPTRGLKGHAEVQVYAPIKDSMGDVVGVLEVFTAAIGS